MDIETIYNDYFRDVYLFLRSLSAEAHIAEEITQETFARALAAIDSLDGRKDIRAWLFTIARNTYYTYCRCNKIYVSEEAAPIAAVPADFAEQTIDAETAFLVHQYLHDMAEPYKEVFTLRVFGELSFEKIAQLFGRTPNWARVTFYRAKRQIIDYMEVVENGNN